MLVKRPAEVRFFMTLETLTIEHPVNVDMNLME
jgi:hypothetical protein